MHPRILFITLFIAAIPHLHGQEKYQTAYLVDKYNKELPGLIADQGEVLNAKTCLFRTDEHSDPVEYRPEEITGYGFAEGNYYESKLISLDNAETLVFAQCLVKGTASLYYYRDADVELYFIHKEGSEMLALIAEKDRYIRLLKASFSDCMEIQSTIDDVDLNHRSLKSITCKYNELMGESEDCTTFGQSSRIELRVGPVAGFSNSQLSLKGDRPFDDFDFKNSNFPILEILLDLSSSRLGEHLSFQLGAEFNKLDFYTHLEQESMFANETWYYNVYYQSLAMAIQTGCKYSFTKKRTRPYLGGGLLLHKNIQPDFWYNWERHQGDYITSGDWSPDIASDLFYGSYLQAGVEMNLRNRMILFASIKGGFAITNPKTIAGLNGSIADQVRIRSELISIGFNLGILF